MPNIFGCNRQRTDPRTEHMGADHVFGPRPHNRASVTGSHVGWSWPIAFQPLDPAEQYVAQYSFGPNDPQTRSMPRHRFMQPQRGILRGTGTAQPWQHQHAGPPNPRARGSPFAPEVPWHRVPTSPLRRRNSSSFPATLCGQHDNCFQRCNSMRRNPFLPHNIPAQFPLSAPPPAPTQPTFQQTQTPMTTESTVMPELPQEAPSLTQWNFPGGTLAWSPHPAPHPNVPATAFWTGNNALQGLPHTTTRQISTTPLDPWQAARLTGGWPLPGADPRWTPDTWPAAASSVPIRLAPYLIPNPANPDMPQIVWDISQNPSRAQRITGAHTIISLSSQFHQQAIVPATEEARIAVESPFVEHLWGPIMATSKSKITVWDILSAIYEFFQKRLTHSEVRYIQSLDPRNYDILVDAYCARCNVTPALPGFERLQGLKRIDILGDKRGFWGIWISFDDSSSSWHLNLGLVNLRPGPPGL